MVEISLGILPRELRSIEEIPTSAARAWPTPTAQDGKNNAGPSQFRRQSLPLNAEVIARTFPTPAGSSDIFPTPNAAKAAQDLSLRRSGDGRTKPNKLGWFVAEKPFPTPRAIYGAHPGMSDPSHLTGAAGAAPERDLRLSAEWTARLMGFPDGYLDLDRDDTSIRDGAAIHSMRFRGIGREEEVA